MRIGWIGLGRMGTPMVERLLKSGQSVEVWNRTRAKAEPLAAKGARIVDGLSDLRGCTIVFAMVSTGKDLAEVLFGAGGLVAESGGATPEIVVDCSTIAAEESAQCRSRLEPLGVQFLAAPVSGNGLCVRAGKLSSVVSGPRKAFERARPLIETYAPRGAAYVGDGELARICKIGHNVMLGVVFQNLLEIMLVAEKAGVPRHAFLDFMNNSVLGSIFTRYKSPALVNLDWTTTFTPELLRKDLDLGLKAGHALGVPMPATAATREVLQWHIGSAASKPDPKAYLAQDFATLLESLAAGAGMKLESENVKVASGLES